MTPSWEGNRLSSGYYKLLRLGFIDHIVSSPLVFPSFVSVIGLQTFFLPWMLKKDTHCAGRLSMIGFSPPGGVPYWKTSCYWFPIVWLLFLGKNSEIRYFRIRRNSRTDLSISEHTARVFNQAECRWGSVLAELRLRLLIHSLEIKASLCISSAQVSDPEFIVLYICQHLACSLNAAVFGDSCSLEIRGARNMEIHFI